jgi:hypothetical protein
MASLSKQPPERCKEKGRPRPVCLNANGVRILAACF